MKTNWIKSSSVNNDVIYNNSTFTRYIYCESIRKEKNQERKKILVIFSIKYMGVITRIVSEE